MDGYSHLLNFSAMKPDQAATIAQGTWYLAPLMAPRHLNPVTMILAVTSLLRRCL